jgi:hypothetical protein
MIFYMKKIYGYGGTRSEVILGGEGTRSEVIKVPDPKCRGTRSEVISGWCGKGLFGRM